MKKGRGKIMKKMLWMVLGSIVILFCQGSDALASEAAYGETMDTPTNIQLDKKYRGSITETHTGEFYKFTLKQSGALHISAKSTDMGNVSYALYRMSGEGLWSAVTNRNSTTGWNSLDENLVLASGQYLFSVMQANGCTGTYEFQMSNDAAGESFPEVDGGSNNSIETASKISLGKAYRGQIAINDERDFYSFTLKAQSELTIDVSEAQGYYTYNIFDGNGNMVWEKHLGANNCHEVIHLTKGKYYFQISRRFDRNGAYKMLLTARKDKETFEEEQGGSNNSLSSANKIQLGKEYAFQLAENDDRDFFQFKLKETTKIIINGSSRVPGWELYNGSGTKVWDLGPWAYPFSEQLELQAGTYYLGIIRSYGASGEYTFSIQPYQPHSAQIAEIKGISSGVKLTWNQVEGATGYKIYRAAGSGSYKLLKVISKGTTTKYADKTMKKGVVYKYKLKTAEGRYLSVYSTVKKGIFLKKPAAPTVKKSGASAILVKVKKDKSAAGYQIQYSTNKKFSKSSKQTSKNASCKIPVGGKGKYYVRVRSYKKIGGTVFYSSWSGAKSVRR